MKKFRLFLFVFILSLTACQEQMEKLSDEATSEFVTAKDRLWMIKEIQGGLDSKAVADITKTWLSGDTIRIKFLNGTETVQNRVKQYASIWLEYADLVFEYVENDADVKISFDWEGKLVSWSTIGTDCQLVPQNESSLNFVYLDDPDEEFVRGEVLRAFGHVLGLGFEHKNPSSPLVFKANATATLQDYYGLTEEEVNDFMAQYQIDQTNYSDYDKSSIMVAEIPGSILVNRRLATTFNTELSENDIAFISTLYKPAEPQRTLKFEVLVDSIYLTYSCFFVDSLQENLYYLQQTESPFPTFIKMNLNSGMKTKLFNAEGRIHDFAVDKQENFYITFENHSLKGIWKYDKNGTRLQQMLSPEGKSFDEVVLFGLDKDDNLYCIESFSNYWAIDTTYIFMFNHGELTSTCIKEMVKEYDVNPYGISSLCMFRGGMLLSYSSTNGLNREYGIYQLDNPIGQNLKKKKLNTDINVLDGFIFTTSCNSDQIYLAISNSENENALYKYDLSSGEKYFVGYLPLSCVKSDGSVLENLSLGGGEVLNDNELLLRAMGPKERNAIIKVNIIIEN